MSSTTTAESSGSEVNINEVIKPYLSKWYWFVISLLIALILAFVFIKFTAPVYEVKSSVLVKDAKKSPSSEFGVLQSIGGLGGMNGNSIENELEIFKSKKLVAEVVNDLKLQTRIFARGQFYDTELYKDTSPIIIQVVYEKKYVELPKKKLRVRINGNKIEVSSDELKKAINTTFDSTISLPYATIIILKNKDFNSFKSKKIKGLDDLYFTYTSAESATESVQKEISQSLLSKDATVVGFSMKAANTDRAIDILNSLVKQYNVDAGGEKNEESKKTKEFIDERISIIGKELDNVEEKKERFRTDNNIVDLSTEAKLGLQITTEAKRKILELETQKEVLGGLLSYIDSRSNSTFLPTNVGLDNATASSNISAYNQLILERNRLLESATAEHPQVKEITKDISNLRKAIRESLIKARTNVQLAIEQASTENQTYSSKISRIPGQEKLFRNIERQQQIKENLYLLLLQKREEAAISLAMTTEKGKVVDYPYVSPKPVAPKKLIILAAALFLGLLIPFGFIYIRQLFNTKIVTKKDISSLSRIPVISELPRLKSKESELIETNSTSSIAEAFRILVTNMNYMLPKSDSGKVVYVTSSIKGEGKTFVSMNLALTIANPKKKVVIIGADIRNPQLQRYSTNSRRLEGLTEYLHSDIDLTTIIHNSENNPYCDIIFSGSIPPNPTDLLTNGKFEQIISELREMYDYIIVDTAPILLVTDTMLITQYSDVILYVTRSEYSDKSLIEHVENTKEFSKISNVGFVLNDVAKENFGYGNKNGYGYGEHEKSWFERLKAKF